VEEIASSYLEHLQAMPGVKDVIVAGSYRRRKETVGDLDILATCKKGSPVTKGFVEYDEVDAVVSRGTTRATVLLRSGLQVDFRVVPQLSYGAASPFRATRTRRATSSTCALAWIKVAGGGSSPRTCSTPGHGAS
jgi:DNA polymerase (family 10)